MHGVPADLPAGSGEFLDRLHEWPRLGTDRAVLHVDDQQRRAPPETGAASETGSTIGFLLVLRDDAVPRVHGGDPRLSSVAVARFERVVAILADNALALVEGGEALAHLVERTVALERAQHVAYRLERGLQCR